MNVVDTDDSHWNLSIDSSGNFVFRSMDKMKKGINDDLPFFFLSFGIKLFLFFLCLDVTSSSTESKIFIYKEMKQIEKRRMALTVMQLLIVSNGKKEKGEKRTSVQYSITQIDTDKAIVEIVLFLFFSFFAFVSNWI